VRAPGQSGRREREGGGKDHVRAPGQSARRKLGLCARARALQVGPQGPAAPRGGAEENRHGQDSAGRTSAGWGSRIARRKERGGLDDATVPQVDTTWGEGHAARLRYQHYSRGGRPAQMPQTTLRSTSGSTCRSPIPPTLPCHTDGAFRRLPVINTSISSRVWPLVSGTTTLTNPKLNTVSARYA